MREEEKQSRRSECTAVYKSSSWKWEVCVEDDLAVMGQTLFGDGEICLLWWRTQQKKSETGDYKAEDWHHEKKEGKMEMRLEAEEEQVCY